MDIFGDVMGKKSCPGIEKQSRNDVFQGNHIWYIIFYKLIFNWKLIINLIKGWEFFRESTNENSKRFIKYTCCYVWK